jgi:hypothetical protein
MTRRQLSGRYEGDLVIVEGRAGVWSYHLARAADEATALCGRPTMPTLLPMSSWGDVTHLKERYCRACELKAAAGGDLQFTPAEAALLLQLLDEASRTAGEFDQAGAALRTAAKRKIRVFLKGAE